MLNNYQKHFVNAFKRYSYNHWRNITINEKQVSEEVAYLSKTYDVKFSDHMSWVSPYCVFKGVDFGRFHIRLSTKYDYCLLYNPKHKHPHSWVSHEVYGATFGNRHYKATCCGDHVSTAFLEGRLIDAYRMYNHTIQNTDTEHAETVSKYHGPNIIEFCHNYNLKKYAICQHCRKGSIVYDECTYKLCSYSPYCEDDDYEDDDEDYDYD